MPRQNLGVVILRRGDLRHGIRDLAQHGRQALLFDTALDALEEKIERQAKRKAKV